MAGADVAAAVVLWWAVLDSDRHTVAPSRGALVLFVGLNLIALASLWGLRLLRAGRRRLGWAVLTAPGALLLLLIAFYAVALATFAPRP